MVLVRSISGWNKTEPQLSSVTASWCRGALQWKVWDWRLLLPYLRLKTVVRVGSTNYMNSTFANRAVLEMNSVKFRLST